MYRNLLVNGYRNMVNFEILKQVFLNESLIIKICNKLNIDINNATDSELKLIYKEIEKYNNIS